MSNDVRPLNLPGTPGPTVNFTADSIRLADLLTDQVSGGSLSSSEQVELDSLLRRAPRLTDERGVVVDEISVGMCFGASIAATFAMSTDSVIPADSKARMLARGMEIARENASNSRAAIAITASNVSTSTGPMKIDAYRDQGHTQGPSHTNSTAPRNLAGSSGLAGSLGWLVAAAAVAFATLTYVNNRPASVGSLREQVQQLASKPGTISIPWTPMGDYAKQGVSGNVYWNNNDQTGYIRFRGVKPNDPALAQFQMWVFDKAQGPVPTAAGVFDVRTPQGAGSEGEYIVQIKPAIRVTDAQMFAISVEQSGGKMTPNTNELVMTAPVTNK